jgi:hypothetical protein
MHYQSDNHYLHICTQYNIEKEVTTDVFQIAIDYFEMYPVETNTLVPLKHFNLASSWIYERK